MTGDDAHGYHRYHDVHREQPLQGYTGDEMTTSKVGQHITPDNRKNSDKISYDSECPVGHHTSWHDVPTKGNKHHNSKDTESSVSNTTGHTREERVQSCPPPMEEEHEEDGGSHIYVDIPPAPAQRGVKERPLKEAPRLRPV